MALVSLATYGDQERELGLSKITYDNKYEKMTQEANCFQTRQIRRCDFIRLDYLAITTENRDISSHLEEFTLSIGGSVIWKIDLGLCCKLASPKWIGNTLMIKLPLDYLTQDLPLMYLQYSDIFYKVKVTPGHHIEEMRILSNCSYLDFAKKNKIARASQELFIQQIQSVRVDLDIPSDKIIQQLPFKSLCKGYFIQGEIKSLSRIQIILNDSQTKHSIWDYDSVILEIYANRISDHLLYISFNNNPDYKSMDRNNYESGLNHTLIQSVKMELQFDQPQNNVCIHAMTSNLLRIRSGIGSLVWSWGDGCYKNYKEAYKLIDLERNDICPISSIEFRPECKYCCCPTCKYNFDAEHLIEFLKTKEVKNCPLCRTTWKDPPIYINGGGGDPPLKTLWIATPFDPNP